MSTVLSICFTVYSVYSNEFFHCHFGSAFNLYMSIHHPFSTSKICSETFLSLLLFTSIFKLFEYHIVLHSYLYFFFLLISLRFSRSAVFSLIHPSVIPFSPLSFFPIELYFFSFSHLSLLSFLSQLTSCSLLFFFFLKSACPFLRLTVDFLFTLSFMTLMLAEAPLHSLHSSFLLPCCIVKLSLPSLLFSASFSSS